MNLDIMRRGSTESALRILVLTKERETTPWGRFLELETVTLCPYDWDAIDEALLEPEERQWLLNIRGGLWRKSALS